MDKAFLVRTETGDQGTFGYMFFGDEQAFTLELPDRDNRPNVSCIPYGKYQCDWTYSPAFKRDMYIVLPVDGRSGIRIHAANLAGDKDKGFKSHLYGCIALGEKRGTLGGQKAVLVSRPAVSLLEDVMDRKSFELEIVNGIA